MATVSQLVDAFLAQAADDGKKPATIKHYTKRLKPFVKRFGDRPFGEITPIEFRTYLSTVNRFPAGHKRAGEQMAAATRASNAIVLQLIEAYAIDLREIPGKILPKLDIPVGARREDLPTDDEAKKILAAARPAFGLIYRALRQSGARPSEMVNATFADWRVADNEIVLDEHKTESSGAKRHIAVGKKLGRILEAATKGRTQGRLFMNCFGEPWTVDALSKTFSRLRNRTGCRRSIVLYCERHWHATKLCEKTSIDEAATALGHKSINTTRRYVHKQKQKLLDNQDLMDDAGEGQASGGCQPPDPCRVDSGSTSN